MMRALHVAGVAAACMAAAALLAGCGGGGGGGGDKPTPTPAPTPTPKPPGPVDCDDKLKRGHCNKCFWTGKEVVCKGCTGHYSLNEKPENPDLFCTFNCSEFQPTPAISKPSNAMQHNGAEWPSVCFPESISTFFTIGDWGGICGWGNANVCKPGVKPPISPFCSQYAEPGKPCPMPNRPGGFNAFIKDIDGIAQRLVSDRMVARQKELQQLQESTTPPARFIVNVGDNFYPGGIDLHCGKPDESATVSQFKQMWKDMYPAPIDELEWWSVLGNHDYGGMCYIKGWDQQIFYTWHDDKWVMPGQYWKRTVQYENFKADFFFIDGNIYDTTPGTSPGHNICNPADNPGDKCALNNYPGDGGNCAPTGPHSAGQCVQWFRDLWRSNYEWLHKVVLASDAEWQILVSHYPAIYDMGSGLDHIQWSRWLPAQGIDLMISGHTHEQRVYYGNLGPGKDMGATAWVITGGGGGVTSEPAASPTGNDDSYGFMEVTLSLHTINITAFSHGGRSGKKIIRNQTSVKPVAAKSRAELLALGLLPPSLTNLGGGVPDMVV